MSSSDSEDLRKDGMDTEEDEDMGKSFAELGVCPEIIDATNLIGWTTPTPIQSRVLPYALKGRDIIGLAETGSGKTGAFAIPVLQALLEAPQAFFACVIAPTRELAFQIGEQFDALGSTIKVKSAVIVGGVDMMTQAIALAKKPHIVIGTPGRLVDHLENTKGFSLRTLKFLVMDEADRILTMDFQEEINQLLSVLPRERRTYLFSATMTSKVAKLQRASLKNPVKIEVSTKYTTPKRLIQQYLFIPAKHKDVYLAYLLNEMAGNTTMVFTATCNTTQRVALLLRHLGFSAISLHGKLSQEKRLGALNKFKSGTRSIIIATDVASRGLDIPAVDVVINFDVPLHSKDYIHRVGRTARAGRAGRAITFVTQYDVELLQRIEKLLEKKLDAYETEKASVLLLAERVNEAQRFATLEMKEMAQKKGRAYNADEEEDQPTSGRKRKGGRGDGGRGGKRKKR